MVDSNNTLLLLLLLGGGLCLTSGVIVLALIVVSRRMASREVEDDYVPTSDATLPQDMGALPAEVEALLRVNQKIEAVKRVREVTGWGLKESKDYVDAIERSL